MSFLDEWLERKALLRNPDLTDEDDDRLDMLANLHRRHLDQRRPRLDCCESGRLHIKARISNDGRKYPEVNPVWCIGEILGHQRLS